jgi:hypothetical protein
LSAEQLLSFYIVKQNSGGHKVNDGGEVETVVTRWLITLATEIYQQRIEHLDKLLTFGEDCVQNSAIAVYLDLKKSYSY